MIIHDNPDDHVVESSRTTCPCPQNRRTPKNYTGEIKIESSRTTCPFHKENPGVPYAGCGCTANWSRRQATPEERRENTIRRLSKELPTLRTTLRAKKRELEIAQKQ